MLCRYRIINNIITNNNRAKSFSLCAKAICNTQFPSVYIWYMLSIIQETRETKEIVSSSYACNIYMFLAIINRFVYWNMGELSVQINLLVCMVLMSVPTKTAHILM